MPSALYAYSQNLWFFVMESRMEKEKDKSKMLQALNAFTNKTVSAIMPHALQIKMSEKIVVFISVAQSNVCRGSRAHWDDF